MYATTRNDYDTVEEYTLAGVTRSFPEACQAALELVVIVNQTARPLL